MKRVQMTMWVVLALAALALAQAAPGKQGSAPAANPQAPAPQAAAPTGIRPPAKAKTQAEYDAYRLAAIKTDPAQMEAAADDFAKKYPDSELRWVLYDQAMKLFSSANDSEHTIECARKVLAIDPDAPLANILLAEELVQSTRDSDLDKEEKYAQASAAANRALKTTDTDLAVPDKTSPEQIQQLRSMLRSLAYEALGRVALARENYALAENNLKQAIDLAGGQADPVVWLQYSISLDRQKKYQDALTAANKAYDGAPAGSPIQSMAQQERTVLTELLKNAGGPPPATTQPASQAPPKQ